MNNEEIEMNPAEAKELGTLLRQRRQKLGLSTHQLAERAHMRQSSIIRMEHGQFGSPRPDKLSRIAHALGFSLSDLYARAGYLVPDDLPSFAHYLSAKYAELPQPAIDELVEHFHELRARHGLVQPGTALTEGRTT